MAKTASVSITRNGKVRTMRNAETILGIIRERGTRGLPLTDAYRQLFQPALYLRAYGRIYRGIVTLTCWRRSGRMP